MSALVFPEKLSLARLNTPLVPLNRLSKQLGGPRIWCKRDDLTGSVESGNKIRKLEYAFAEAQRLGCNTVISCGGTQSNHCRATAAIAAQLGFKCHLILREDTPASDLTGNLLLDNVLGATVDIYPRKRYGAELTALLAATKQSYDESGAKAYVIPTGASDGVGLWGYIEAARELQQDFTQLNISPEQIICATGSGGTQGGLTLGASVLGLDAAVLGVAVCDNVDYFDKKIREDWAHWTEHYQQNVDINLAEISTVDGYIGEGYGIANDDVFETIALVARTEGLVLDPTYTGKAFHGLIGELRTGRFNGMNDIVFIHTGGVYGLMAQHRQFGAWLNR